MSSVVDGVALGCFGVGRFRDDMNGNIPVLSVMNVAGWIPVVSVIAGVVRCFFGVAVLVSEENSAEEKVACGIQIVRGLAEICCVGCIAAPVDLAVTAVRLVRDYHNSRPSENLKQI